MNILPEAYVSHCSNRRLRIKVPSQRGSDSFFRMIEERFSTLPGIEAVEVNPLTGSVLIFHHSDAPSVCEWISQRRIISLKETIAKRTKVRHDLIRGLKTVNTHVSSLTDGKVDLWDVAGLSLIGAGAYQLIRGNFLAPAWYTAFWYAFGILSKAQSGDNPTGD